MSQSTGHGAEPPSRGGTPADPGRARFFRRFTRTGVTPAVSVELAAQVRAAIEAPDPFAAGLVVRYLPKLTVPGGELAGVEALVHFGAVEPGPPSHDAFLGLRQDGALMERLTFAVIETAGEDSLAWGVPGRGIAITVDLPTAVILRPGFTDRLTTLLRRTGLDAGSWAVELRAEQFATAPDRLRAELARLRLEGIHVVIDDFGTQPVDRDALRLGTVDEIKLDRALLSDLVADETAQARVADLIDAAHQAGIKAVAQGVTDDQQLDRLRRLGIDAVQGPLLADPVEPTWFSRWIVQQYPTDRSTRPTGGRGPEGASVEAKGHRRAPHPTGTGLGAGREQRFAPRKAWRGQPAFLRVPVEGWRNTSNRLPVKIADYSWTGVGFFLDEHIVLPAEWEVVLEIDTVSIPMRVRRSAPVERSRLTYHGAEFVAPGPDVAAELERVALHRVDDVRSAVPDGDPVGLPTGPWILPTGPDDADRARSRAIRRRTAGSVPNAPSVREPASDLPAAPPRPVGLAAAAEKRIGRRHDVYHSIILIPPHGPRRRSRPIPGQLFDLSVSGAGVIASANPAIHPGRVLEIEIDGRRGGARIRRVADDPTTGQTRFGVEFTDERLSSTIISILGALDRDDQAVAAGPSAHR